MATVSFVPGKVNIDLAVQTKTNIIPEQAREAPGGLYPMRASTYELDEYRIMAGWPVAVPDYDIRVSSLVSASGEVLGYREDPTEINTGAALRWVADANYFDETSLTWSPIQGGAVAWQTSADFAPVLITDYEYRVGAERFAEMTALNFDSDARNHMWANLGPLLAGATGYTVIFVFSPNSVYGNDVDVPYNGLWCQGRATGAGDTFDEPTDMAWNNLTMQGNYIYLQTDQRPRTIGVPIAETLNNNAPSLVAVTFQRPMTTLYAAGGPSSMLSKQLPAGESPVTLDANVVLGRSTGDVLHTADMALFDLGIYPDALTTEQVHNEFALLSRVYGGDS